MRIEGNYKGTEDLFLETEILHKKQINFFEKMLHKITLYHRKRLFEEAFSYIEIKQASNTEAIFLF